MKLNPFKMKLNPWAQFEDKIDPEIPVATLQIYEQIAKDLLNRGDNTNVNRGSAATLCYKRRWYQRNGYEGVPLTPRKIVNFVQGDIAEKVIIHFICEGLVGPTKFYSEVDFGEPLIKNIIREKFGGLLLRLATILSKTFTKEWTQLQRLLQFVYDFGFFIQNGYMVRDFAQRDLRTQVGDIEVISHADGFGKRNSDGKWELIEVKSYSNYGFTDFKNKGPGAYLKQSHILMESDHAKQKGIKEVRFFALRKETGHIWDSVHKFDDRIWNEVVREYEIAAGEAEPDRPHELVKETRYRKPTGRLKADFPCSYCPYIETCFKGIRKEFKDGPSGSSPIFVMDDPDYEGDDK